MNPETTTRTTFDDVNPPKMSTGLNVLTILSIIGCVLQAISSLWGYTSARKAYEERDKSLEQMKSEEVPAFLKKLMPDPKEFVELVTKNYENRLPILLLSLIAVGLCFYGVLQMRKLKKQGYTFYVIGELLPVLTMALFLGATAFSLGNLIFVVVIPVVFILLYTVMRKQLIY